MLEFRQLESFYPEHLRPFKRNILREYLQYKMLAAIFGGKFGARLVFMGGTAIHIAHGLGRFSEDLDFDNQGLARNDFRLLVQDVSRNLILEGFAVETGVSFKGAFSADIKVTGLLFEVGLSGHKEEKVLVKIDTEPQDFGYSPRRVIINKFDVLAGISVVPADILLAQKFYAILNRRRAVGRDFYDAMFLAGKTRPDFGYLKAKYEIADMPALKTALLDRCAKLDFKQLARDVAPLVFIPGDAKKVELFPEFVRRMG
ncbi:MAG: nucleotidyl transferase AbiEii/AbiGii toxin family protein [Candidatus Omnitrophica bacterium]|nr:nucleotidyl transferase AbiEii/AbiGii toxin family protein [Candidatus Omnitrophota bacterium]